jgi:dTDP-4-amino-4,6-dideoxygalactose transaminase
VVKLKNADRDDLFVKLKNAGIGVNVHYMPIYLHPYYLSLGYSKGLCPIAEKLYNQIITLPMFPLLKDDEIKYICSKIF